MRNLLKKPSQEQISCQYPKPIVLDTGEMKEPYDWAVSIYSDLHLYVCQRMGLFIEFVEVPCRLSV